jgi:hypothetical protein
LREGERHHADRGEADETPETTEKAGLTIAATLPDSTSPRRGPPATTRL